ncbi:hypothetical protein MTP99_002954 [Tenebrio molitor]|nr:hypothetical protein MTP99_002954 [Tenebrio molitor]
MFVFTEIIDCIFLLFSKILSPVLSISPPMVSFRKSLCSTLWTPQRDCDNVITFPIHLQHICELIIFLIIKPFRLIR